MLAAPGDSGGLAARAPALTTTMAAPDVPFLEALVHRADARIDPATGAHTVGLTGLCAGYECDRWRCDQLAAYLVETWLPDFALRYSELTNVPSQRWGPLLRRAARSVYTTPRSTHRGEFGELLLHAALVQTFQTLPAISKVYFKDGPNETVKGFDAVHVVPAADGSLELWLGEAKFYSDIGDAIREAVGSLAAHDRADYLRDEFAAILGKVDDAWPHAAALRRLLDRNTSLDQIFAAACIPVLLTYDSPTVAAYVRRDDAYVAAIRAEWERHHQDLSGRRLPPRVKVHLLLVPLQEKVRLVAALDAELRRWQ